jgi:hypothetical protein
MNPIPRLVLTSSVCAIMLVSCKKSSAAAEESLTESLIATADTLSSQAAVEKKGETRKFLRKADLKFKVKNVAQSTYAIENAVNRFGGFVTYTNLQSTISEKAETKISQDSLLETTKFTVDNNLILRIPNTRLDTLLKTIAKQIDFLDYRLIKADDVSLQMMANQMTQNRNAKQQKRTEKAIDTKGKKLTEISHAEDELANKAEQNDNSKIENLSLQDQVNFSTLTLEIYQRESTKREMVARDNDSYRSSFIIRLQDALKSGWYMIQDVITVIIQLWALLLIALLGFLLYKKYLKK